MQSCTVDEIMRTSNRLPFADHQIKSVFSNTTKQNQRGLDVHFHPNFASTSEDAIAGMKQGIFVLRCPQIRSDFVFIHENAGKGLFGGQKSSYRTFIADIDQNNFSAVSSYKVFTIALTSINNVFRAEGFLEGTL